jgi:putative hydrolase of the HAD superfamily
MKNKNIKIIGFDADDTLWVNEPYYRNTEKKLCQILEKFTPLENSKKLLYEIEIKNLPIYGYGTKAFTLSLIETALKASNNQINGIDIEKIVTLGKNQILQENEILPGVKETLEQLSKKHVLIVATKGDLLDQERKLLNSGLLDYFHHIEVMSDKKVSNYNRLLKHLDIKPDQFLMIGNSLKSDILPVVELGCQAIYIPFHTTWEYEKVSDKDLPVGKYVEIKNISELLKLI